MSIVKLAEFWLSLTNIYSAEISNRMRFPIWVYSYTIYPEINYIVASVKWTSWVPNRLHHSIFCNFIASIFYHHYTAVLSINQGTRWNDENYNTRIEYVSSIPESQWVTTIYVDRMHSRTRTAIVAALRRQSSIIAIFWYLSLKICSASSANWRFY